MKRQISSTGKSSKEGGFSFVIVLVLLVVVSITAQIAAMSSSRLTRSDKEKELLFRGSAYLNAIESYYLSIPENPAYPRYLTDLVKDPRFLHKRHIRQLYSEPFVGEWNVLRNSAGAIIGVASSSQKSPLKIDNFPSEFNAFIGAENYSDWEFIYIPTSQLNLSR